MKQRPEIPSGHADAVIVLFLCGDVMTGRGIDQILPHPGDPTLHERSVAEATRYVELAERRSGPISRHVDFGYVWGEALEELERAAPDLRVVNLETAVTESDAYWKGKAVHYRMNPRNMPCLTAAGIDCCVLANNHVLDWGYPGLEDTLRALEKAGIETAGAGLDLAEAQRPAVFERPGGGRVLVFAAGSTTSGIPRQWAAAVHRPGVHLIDEASPDAASRMRQVVERFTRPGDLVVVSIHWGPNWGYEISPAQRRLAHALIDEAGVDLVHGHSSHHVKGVELYRDRPILYGCGDFLTDYEGIEGYERFRDDLGLMYFARIDAHTHRLDRLDLQPTRLKRLQVQRASPGEAAWMAAVLDREGRALATRVELADGGRLHVRPTEWSEEGHG